MTDQQGRLGADMAARRRELRLSVRAAANLAKINRATWASIEAGARAPQSYTRAGIEDALRWEAGSIDAILAGGEPTAAQAGAAQGTAPAGPTTTKEIQDEINRIAELADLSADDKWRLVCPLLALLRQATAERQQRQRQQEAS